MIARAIVDFHGNTQQVPSFDDVHAHTSEVVVLYDDEVKNIISYALTNEPIEYMKKIERAYDLAKGRQIAYEDHKLAVK